MSPMADLFERAAAAWLSWMWPMAWQAALMAAALLAAVWAARKAPPRFRNLLWCLLLIKLCLPPDLSFVTGIGQWLPAPEVEPVIAGPVLPAAPATEPMAPTEMPSRETPPAVEPMAPLVASERVPAAETPRSAPAGYRPSWRALLFGTWLIGVALMALLVAFQHLRMARLLGRGGPVEGAGLLAMLEEAKHALRLNVRVSLIAAPDLESPILFGLLRPKIAVPTEALRTLPPEQVRPILLHELSHLKRHDLWVNGFQMLLQVVYWFHPLVWIANARMRRERELIVDDMVLAQLGGERRTYGDSLLSIIRHSVKRRSLAPGYVGIMEPRTRIAHRLARILDDKRKLPLRLGWAFLLAAVLLGLILIPQAKTQDQPKEPAVVKLAPEGGTGQTPAPIEARKTVEEVVVNGDVVDEDGKLLAGARVILYHKKSNWGLGNRIVGETRTGADGAFRFDEAARYDNPLRGAEGLETYILLADRGGYAFGWHIIHPGKEKPPFRLVLTPPMPRTLNVIDTNLRPVEGARIRIGVAGDPNATNPIFREGLDLPTDVGIPGVMTDAAGKAVIADLPATSCSLIAEKPGYASNFWGLYSNIILTPGANLSGRVVAGDGAPVPDAKIWLYPTFNYHFYRWGVTDAEGRFEIKDIPPNRWENRARVTGEYTVRLESADYAAPEGKVAFEPGQTISDFVIRADRGTKVHVIVLDPQTQEPVAGARVQGFTASGRLDGYADMSGAVEWAVASGEADFFFDSPPPGTYVLESPEGGSVPQKVNIAGESATLTLLAPGHIGAMVALRGRLLLPDGRPAYGVVLVQACKVRYNAARYVGGSGTTAVTDANGLFELADVPADLAVTLFGETPDRRYAISEEIPPRGTGEEVSELSQPLLMRQGQSVEIVISDEEGKPRVDFSIKMLPSMWGRELMRAEEHAFKTDAEGRARLDGILPGQEYFLIDAKANQSKAEWRSRFFYTTQTLIPASTSADKAPVINLVAPVETDRTFIKVVDAHGKPVPVKSMTNLITELDGQPWYTGGDLSIVKTLPDDTVVVNRGDLAACRPGAKITITVASDVAQDLTAKGVYPSDGSNRIMLTTEAALPEAEILTANLTAMEAAVKVLDPNGQPVTGAKVTAVRSPAAKWNVTVTTNTQGVATLNDLERVHEGATYRRYKYVQVEAPDCAPLWLPVVTRGKATVARLDNTTRLAGRLILPDGKPAAAADIRIALEKYTEIGGADFELATFPFHVRCDEQGGYSLLLMPGIYGIEALSDAGYFGKWPDFRVERGKTISLPEKLEPAARLEVKTVDSESGKPVDGVELFIWESSQSHMWLREGSIRVTDANGVAVWDALVPGGTGVDLARTEYARCWSDQSYSGQRRPGAKGNRQLSEGVHSLHFDVSRDMKPVTVVVERAVMVKGQVFSPEGWPVANVVVNVCGPERHPFTGDARFEKSTDAEGKYSLSLPAGNGIAYAVIAHDPESRWANVVSKSFQSKPGDTLAFDLKLTAGGRATGRVMDEQGRPVPGVEVEAALIRGSDNMVYDPRTLTNDQGEFVLKAMRPGTYLIYPDKAENLNTKLAGAAGTIEVREGETVSIGDLVWSASLPAADR